MGKQRSFRQVSKRLTADPKGKRILGRCRKCRDLGGWKKPFGGNKLAWRKWRVWNLRAISNKGGRGGGKSENKAACFERGHADHFKEQLLIWAKRKKMVTRRKTAKWDQGKGISEGK